MARRPSYVNNVLKEGEFASYDAKSGQWKIYRLTSKRVPGVNNPIKERIYMAVCTPWGRKDIEEDCAPKRELMQFSTWEYGASRVLEQKIPAKWLCNYQEYSHPIFLDAIKDVLPESYLLRKQDYSVPEKKVNVGMRKKLLWRFYEDEGITLEVLAALKSIKLLCYDDREIVSNPNEEQAKLLKILGVLLV